MAREFVITTETNTDLSLAYLQENQIGVIPHYYTVGEEVYGGGRELTIQEFYQEMRDGKKVGTMASNPAVIADVFTAYAKEGKDVLHISFSGALSCGCANVQMVANEVMEEYPDMKIIVVDTLSVSLGEGMMIAKALELKAAGKTVEETAKEIEALLPHICVQFTVDDLEYLYRGGRVSKTTAVVASIVNIKPILYVNEEGKLVSLDKVRGRQQSIKKLVENMKTRIGEWRDKQIFVGIVHGDCEADAMKLADLVKAELGDVKLVIEPVGPSIGAHSGPGALGILFLGEAK